MANSDPLPVFVDTSLGTNLGTVVSFDDTIASFRRKIEAEHVITFPEIGEIVVQAVKTCREGIMYRLSDSMPVYAAFSGMNGTWLLHLEAVSTKHKRNLGIRRNGEEIKVSIGGMVEDLVVSEVDPLHNPAEGPSNVVNVIEDRKRKKEALRLKKSRKRKDEGFEGSSVQEEPGNIMSKQEGEMNAETINPAVTNLVNFHGENQTQENSHHGANACESKKGESSKGDRSSTKDGSQENSSDKKRRRKKAKVPEPANDASVAVGESHSMEEVAREARSEKEKDIPGKNLGHDSLSAGIPDNANLMEPNISNPAEHIPTEELTSNAVHPFANEEADLTDQNAQAKGDVDFGDQPDANQMLDGENTNQGTNEGADPAKVANQVCSTSCIAELVEAKARKGDTLKAQSSQEVSQMVGAGSGGVIKENKKRRKAKGFSSNVPSEVPPIREDEPQGENSIQVSEKKDSDVPENPDDANLMASNLENPIELKQPQNLNSRMIPAERRKKKIETEHNSQPEGAIKFHDQPDTDQILNSGSANQGAEESADPTEEHKHGGDSSGTAESVKDKFRKKGKKTKGRSSDVPSEVPPIREDVSEKADDKVHESNQVVEKERGTDILQKSGVGGTTETENAMSCQLDKERLEPEMSAPADKDTRFQNKLGIQQAAIANSKEDSRKGVENSKETAEVVSVETRRRKKKKSATVEGLAQEARENDSVQKRENAFVLEKEIGGDPEVISEEKRKHKKTMDASKDMSPQELSAVENESIKKREKNLIVEKEASTEVGDAHFSNNPGDVAFPASKSEDPNDLVNEIVSQIQADLMAVDQRKVEQALGLVETKKERRKSKRESSNKTLTSQDTMNLVTGEAVISQSEKRRHRRAKTASPENEIESRETFVLASSPGEGAQNQTMDSSIVVGSVGDGKKKKKRKEEAVKSKVEASDEAYGTTVADRTTQNAPITEEKVQKSENNIWAENQNKEASAEGAQEKINFFDYFLHKRTDQPSDGTTSLKKTRGKKKIQSSSFPEHCPSASVDTTVSEKPKKPTDRNETTEKPVKISKVLSDIASETSNDKSKACTSMKHLPKRDNSMKSLLADMAALSDASTEDNEETRSQLRRPMVAVRKVASKSIGEDMNACSKNSSVVSSGAVFDGAASEASTRDEDGNVDRGSPMTRKEKGRDMMSSGSSWKKEVADDDMPMSQESTRPGKNVNLSSILRSSASYKKAKVSVSQSQAENPGMIDVIFETQPDLIS